VTGRELALTLSKELPAGRVTLSRLATDSPLPEREDADAAIALAGVVGGHGFELGPKGGLVGTVARRR